MLRSALGEDHVALVIEEGQQAPGLDAYRSEEILGRSLMLPQTPAAPTLSLSSPDLLITNFHATPQYARMYRTQSCTTCHVVAPKLNAIGEDFLARGYRFHREGGPQSTVPVAIWITGRQEEQFSQDFSELYLNRVELISGGPIGELPLSYFVEWRLVSLETRSDGTLRDRSGRFEDAFINLELGDRFAVTAGQFRALNQIDISRRLSVSEPAAFSTSLPGEPDDDPRITSLRAFSPSGRSPGVAVSFQSITGESASDGLFHRATLPFVGEFSIPLTPEARQEASFELEGPPKGLFLETYYRQRLNSIGGHAFIDDDRWLLMGVGTLNFKDFYVTGGLGVDDQEGTSERGRYSLEVEYLPDWSDRWRPGVGFRVEQISHAGREPAYIPYLVLSGPNKDYTVLLQVEYRSQEGNDALFIDLSFLY